MFLKLLYVAFATVTLSTAELQDPSTNQESPIQPKNDAISRTCSTSNRYSGIQMVQPQPGFGQPFEVYCEQEYEDGGWVVIQNRFDGSVNFNRDWVDYERGFGDMSGEHWLGLAKIHELTYSKQYRLHVILELSNGTQLTARYSDFSVAGPSELYQLKSVGGFSGDLPNEFGYQTGMKFSTFDADNDIYFGNCAENYSGGWWFSSCGWSFLNAPYNEISWYPFYNDIKKTQMIIKVID